MVQFQLVSKYQKSTYAAANSGIARDADTTYMGIAFNVNENLSISYGEQETDLAGVSVDQELEGFSIGYSMGGISLKAHSNEGTNGWNCNKCF